MAEEVVIVIRGDDKVSPALEAAAKAIEDVSEASEDASKSFSKMGKDGEDAADSVSGLGNAAKGADKSAAGMLSQIKGLAAAHPALIAGAAAATAAIAAAGFAFKAAYDVMQQGVEAFKDQDAANRALESSLRTAGFAGEPLRAEIDLINESISELSRTTMYGDEELARMASTFISVSGQASVSGEQMKAIADIAAGMGVSTEQAARVMAAAMKGDLPEGLERVTTLTKTQIAEIQAMKDPAERAAAAQNILAESFAGSAENVNGYFLAIKNLDAAQNDLLQKIGELITESGAFEPAINAVSEAFGRLEAFIDENKVAIQSFIIDGVAQAIGAVAGFIERLQALSPVFATVTTAVQVAVNQWDNLYQGVRLVASAMQALQTQVIGRLLQGLSGLLTGVSKLAGFFNKDFGEAMDFAAKKVAEFSEITLEMSDDALQDVVKRSENINENIGDIVDAVKGWSDTNEAINKGLGAAAGTLRDVEASTLAAKDNLGKVKDEVDAIGKTKIDLTPKVDTKKAEDEAKRLAEEKARNEIAAARLAILREQDPLQRAVLEVAARELELGQKKLTDKERELELLKIQTDFEERLASIDADAEKLRITQMKLDALRESEPYQKAEIEYEAERLSILNSGLPLIEQQIQLEQLQIAQGERLNSIRKEQIQLTMQANQETLSGLSGILPGLDGLAIGLANIRDLQWGTKEATDSVMGAMSGLAAMGGGLANIITEDKKKSAAIEAAFNAAAAVGSFASWAATGFTAVPLGIATAQHTLAAGQFAAIAGGAGANKPSAASASAPSGAGRAAREYSPNQRGEDKGNSTIINIDFGSSTQLSSAVDTARAISRSVTMDAASGWSLGGV